VEFEVPADSGYVSDLVDPQPRRRERAVQRHAEYVGALNDALRWHNDIWRRAERASALSDPAVAAAMDQASAAYRDALAHTVQGLVGCFLSAWRPEHAEDRARLAPYGVLFLRWETEFPEQWRHAGPYSPWHAKKEVLRNFSRFGIPPPQRDQLTSLLIAAVHRAHRCEDRGYSTLARRLDGPVLRAALGLAAESTSPHARLRARYVQWVIDHEDEPVTLAGWRRWLGDAC
jgi:hypothetical protein